MKIKVSSAEELAVLIKILCSYNNFSVKVHYGLLTKGDGGFGLYSYYVEILGEEKCN